MDEIKITDFPEKGKESQYPVKIFVSYEQRLKKDPTVNLIGNTIVYLSRSIKDLEDIWALESAIQDGMTSMDYKVITWKEL